MKKVLLLTNHYEGMPLEILKAAVKEDFELRILPEATREALLDNVGEADYLLVSGRLAIDKTVISKAVKVKMIQRTGVGLDNIDLEALKDVGIPLYVNRGVNSESVAEYTVMLMLAALKRCYQINKQVRSGIWKKQATGLKTGLISGKTIGIVGMGNIGKKVAHMLSGFDAKIVYYDAIKMTDEEESEYKVSFVSLDEMLKNSDIITLHCPYNPSEGPLFGREEFSKMKDGAVIINTARGKLIDQASLVEALESGKISTCGIDTFEEEPLSNDCPLYKYDQALLSPHIAGLSYDAFDAMMTLGVENIRAFDKEEIESIEKNRVV